MKHPCPPPLALDEAHTFETFIVGPENELAYRTAMSVADAPGRSYNPLLIHGTTGLGKTHLLHAIAHSVSRKNPSARILYVTCEAFSEEYIRATRTPEGDERDRKRDEFKKKYREVDLLLIDDIHFLSGRVGTQEELFNLFNHLQSNRRQLVFTSSRPVRMIKALSDFLVSRFQGGMTAEIQPPGQATRLAIVESKASATGVQLPRDVIEFLSGRIGHDIRKIEGAVTRAAAYAKLGDPREITVTRLEQLLQDLLIVET